MQKNSFDLELYSNSFSDKNFIQIKNKNSPLNKSKSKSKSKTKILFSKYIENSKENFLEKKLLNYYPDLVKGIIEREFNKPLSTEILNDLVHKLKIPELKTYENYCCNFTFTEKKNYCNYNNYYNNFNSNLCQYNYNKDYLNEKLFVDKENFNIDNNNFKQEKFKVKNYEKFNVNNNRNDNSENYRNKNNNNNIIVKKHNKNKNIKNLNRNKFSSNSNNINNNYHYSNENLDKDF
jgi:hypothetical protein